MKRLTLRRINEALAKVGEERLARGQGYFYFYGGNASNWWETGVYVSKLSALSVKEWLAERERLVWSNNPPAPKSIFEEAIDALKVITETEHIRKYLFNNDPKALEQVDGVINKYNKSTQEIQRKILLFHKI